MHATETRRAVLKTLVISDLVKSTRLVEQLGDSRAAEIFQRHDRFARDLLRHFDGREIDHTDGFLLLFERPISALLYARAYHRALVGLAEEEGVALTARVGIHLGEVLLRENRPEDVARGAKPLEVEGLAKAMAARLMALAGGGQTLLTRGAFDLARRGAVGEIPADVTLEWRAHGNYLFDGVEEPVEVFEAGEEGISPLAPPTGSEKARSIEDRATVLGWRPAPNQEIPGRPSWRLERKLGSGRFGEVWLAEHTKTHERRSFKFCYEAERLRSLRREVTLFRVLKETLGDREDITRILDWNFEEPPYYLEAEYSQAGNLIEWAMQKGGLDAVPLETRLEIASQVARAMAAAHSVGVLHKDIKPENILIETPRPDRVRARLTDFGIGKVLDPESLKDVNVTMSGLHRAQTTEIFSSGSRSVFYLAPEVAEGKPSTVQADVYALGVVLFQLVVGDFNRALAPGWERSVEDPLLCADVAAAVDGSPERRLDSASRVADNIRSLEERRRELREREEARAEAQRTRIVLSKGRRRRRILLAVGAVLILLAAGASFQLRRLSLEAERVERTIAANSELAEILAAMIEAEHAGRGDAEEIQVKIERRIENLLADAGGDPATRAQILHTLGTVSLHSGRPDRARGYLEEALALRKSLLPSDDADLAATRQALAAAGGASGV